MASETSRSGGSADSYIGSLISLTSKSEIRYEGILYQINTEEASIGLRSVRSFGTEGRRKDGPQIPPIDRVYEYIVFRGSDIKDLQVKSSPPAPSSQPVHNDPAIIQSHYSQAAATSSLPPVNNVSPSDLSAPMLPQSGPPRPSLQSNLPLYQPVGPLTWGGPASVAPSAVNSTGPSMPLYWQGYYGPSSVLQGQPPPQSLMQPPQSLMQPPQSLMIPPSSQQSVSSVSNPSMNLPVSSSVSPSPDFQPSFGSLGSSVLNMQPTMFPGQGPSVMSESSASQLASKSAAQAAQGLSASSQIANLPLGSAVPHMMDKNAISAMPSHGNLISGPMISSLSGFSEHLSAAAVVGTSSSPPSLVTPGQFLQPGPTSTFHLSHPVQTAQKDVEVAPVSSLSLPMPDVVTSAPLSTSASASESASGSVSVPTSAPSETQTPLLPLPSPSNSKFNRGPGYMRHNNHRGGRRGSELLHSATSYTEEFDFEAMNEKFKKDEVWGHLGKSKANEEDDEDIQYEDDIEFPKVDVKPVYNKDDFFDSLSSNNIDGGSRGGRPRFSEQMRLDTETFGSFSRYRGGRGGRGLGRGGRYRGGGYYGRGYGYVGRGRGGYGAYRAM